jgi:hypothetical protein
MVRYVTGLLGAFLVFGAALAVALTSVLTIEGRSVRLATVLDVWFRLGLLGTAGIAIIVGPIMLAMRHSSKKRLSVPAAAFSGASLAPALLFALWLVFRERDETVATLLQFWARVPGEFFVGIVPHAAASAFFGGWLVAGSPRPKSLPTQPLQPTSGGRASDLGRTVERAARG